MMPFNNRVQVIDILGSDLLPAFTQMARVGGNGVSRGVDIAFEPKTASHDARILSATINGEPLDPARTYRVATIDYVAQGGDYMPTMAHHTQVASSPTEVYKDLLAYLRTGAHAGRKINPPATARMHSAR